jgi:hypothetical protein
MTATLAPAVPRPRWITLAALGGIGWNIFGLVQFAASATATAESLIASGLTPEQAVVMTGYPVWMTAAFFLGVTGGLVGSVLLALRSALARPVLLASLVAYVALWVGDAVHGVFAVMGAPQVAILTTVVAIAAALFAIANRKSAHA